MRRVLQIVSIVCLILFLIPGYSHEVQQDRSVRSFKLGLPFSPWARMGMERTKTENGETNTTNWKVEFLSWSFLAAIVGYAADWGAKRLRRNEPV